MSDNITFSIDATAAQQQAIATAINELNTDFEELANIVTQLTTINATLLIELDKISRNLSTQGSQSLTLSVQCCPQAVYDCDTGETRWIDPPKKVGGSGGGTIISEDGGVKILDAIDDIGPDGTANGEYNFGENDGTGRGYTSTTDGDATVCNNANWFVYSCNELMDSLESSFSIMELGIDSVTGIMGGLGLIGTTPFLYYTIGSAAVATYITVGISTATVIAITALVNKILSLAGAGLKAQWSSQLEADLVCAIVVGANQAGGYGIKKRWDDTINTYVPALNPLRWYYKYLLTKDMANAIAKGQLQEDEAKYGYICNCSGGGYLAVYTWKDYGSGYGRDGGAIYYYIFPSSGNLSGIHQIDGGSCSWDSVRWTFSDMDSTENTACRVRHAGTLKGYRIRETSGVGAELKANNPGSTACDSWDISLTIPADGSWLEINQETEYANIRRSDNGDFAIEIEPIP